MRLRKPQKHRFDSGSGHKLNADFQPLKNHLPTYFQKVAQEVAEGLKLVSPQSDINFMTAKPYILPKLIIPSKKAKDKRIHIQYHVWDEFKGKMVRIRYFKIPGENVRDQINQAKVIIIPFIENKLLTGAVINSNKMAIKPDSNKTRLTIINAIKYAYELKKIRLGDRAKGNYAYYISGFEEYLISSNLQYTGIEKLTGDVARNFQIYLSEKGYSNRTINNFMDTIKTMVNALMKLDNPPILKNPFTAITHIKVGMGKNIAFNKEQKILILDYSQTKWPQAYLLGLFMYYTLMRTNEICEIQRKHIGYYQPGYIYLEGIDNSKRIYSRNIIITDHLNQLFNEFGIYDLPTDYYLFSKDRMLPGPEKIETKRMGGKYREWILDMIPELKGKREYTLYSWKHTGVVAAYVSGIAPYNIMQQTGHRDRQGFETYLKSLGLVTKSDFNAKMPMPTDF